MFLSERTARGVLPEENKVNSNFSGQTRDEPRRLSEINLSKGKYFAQNVPNLAKLIIKKKLNMLKTF